MENINSYQKYTINFLKGTGWDLKLAPFIMSPTFSNIVKKIIEEREAGFESTPRFVDWFRAFKECPYSKLHSLVLALDPYPQRGVATGIAMDCGFTMREQPTLVQWNNALEAEFNNGINKFTRYPSLLHLANQGVLLLNCALTTRVGETGSHLELWRPFIDYLISLFDSYNPGLIIILLGKEAQKYEKYFPATKYTVLKESHPVSAKYSGGIWRPKDFFASWRSHVLLNFAENLEYTYERYFDPNKRGSSKLLHDGMQPV